MFGSRPPKFSGASVAVGEAPSLLPNLCIGVGWAFNGCALTSGG